MNSKKQINIGVSSSLIDLKAELLKKQRELEVTKSKQRGVTKSISKTQILKSKKLTHKRNAGVEKRNAADLEEQEKSIKTYEKAKEVLEAKARLYDKMQSEALQHDANEHPVLANSLVDFQKKAIDTYKEAKKKKEKIRDIDPDKSFSLTSYRDLDGVDDEMVEFIDTLGRTRRCKRSQLAKAMAIDEQLAREEKTATGADSNTNNNSVIKNDNNSGSGKVDDIKTAVYSAVPPPTALNLSNIMTEERVTDMKHRKWEEETEAATAKNDVHYEDVLFDEIRTHGVAYYGFSKDEEKRAEEIRELKKLSEQTKTTREKVKKERDQKSKQLKIRLLKVKNKKRAKLGLPPLQLSPETSDDDDDDNKDETETDKVKGETNIEGDGESESSSKEIRPWDFGKPGVFGPKPVNFDELDAKWLIDRRSERHDEFQPPTTYTQNKNYKPSTVTSSSTKYGNFVQSMENAMKLQSKVHDQFPPPPPPPKKQQKLYDESPNLYRQQEQFPTRINDELPSLTPDTIDYQKRGTTGAEIAPPTNYDEIEPPKKKPNTNICDSGSIFNSISEGIRAIREQTERKQKEQQQKVEKQSFFSKAGPEADDDDDD